MKLINRASVIMQTDFDKLVAVGWNTIVGTPQDVPKLADTLSEWRKNRLHEPGSWRESIQRRGTKRAILVRRIKDSAVQAPSGDDKWGSLAGISVLGFHQVQRRRLSSTQAAGCVVQLLY